MMSLSPWTAIRCMWLESQAHRGKPEGHACHASPCSVSSRRFAGFAQKAATHRCNGLDVPTFCHHHHATAPPIYVKGRPYFVSKENHSNRLPHLHCSRSRSWEAGHSSACAWACLCRWRAPCEHKHLSSAQALILGASVTDILAPTALLRPPQAQIRAPFTETAGAITSRRPSSDPPSYSERFDARLLRSVHRPHDQRNTQAAPSQSGSPSLRDVFA